MYSKDLVPLSTTQKAKPSKPLSANFSQVLAHTDAQQRALENGADVPRRNGVLMFIIK
jgi:hypothetical protein